MFFGILHEIFSDFFLQNLKIFRFCRLGIGEFEFFPSNTWYQVIMGMRNFESRKHTTYTYTSADFFQYRTQYFCCLEDGTIIRLRDIGDMIYLDFRNDQSMSRSMWIYIEKSKHILIFIDFV